MPAPGVGRSAARAARTEIAIAPGVQAGCEPTLAPAIAYLRYDFKRSLQDCARSFFFAQTGSGLFSGFPEAILTSSLHTCMRISHVRLPSKFLMEASGSGLRGQVRLGDSSLNSAILV